MRTLILIIDVSHCICTFNDNAECQLCTFLAVGSSVLHVEGTVSERLVAVGAHEAVGMPLFVQGIQAVLNRIKQSYSVLSIILLRVSFLKDN